MGCLTPSLHRRPPDGVVKQFHNIPAPFALILVWQDGTIENAEFVADYYEGTERWGVETFSWQGEWSRWRKNVEPKIPKNKNYELWAKQRDEIFMVHPNQWWV